MFQMKSEDKVDFPAVTICNLNPLNTKTKLINHETYGAFVRVQQKHTTPSQFNP